MAISTPLRISGSPPLPISRVSAEERPRSLLVVLSVPVTTRPQVAAFTNSDGLWPIWARQSPAAILSRISASRVGRSGMRSSASARHIRATPSCVESAYSRTRPSTRPAGSLARNASTNVRARERARSACSGGRLAPAISSGTHSVSGIRVAAVMRPRSALWGARSRTKPRNGPSAVGAAAPSPSASSKRSPRSARSIAAMTPCRASQCGVRPTCAAAPFSRARSVSSILIAMVPFMLIPRDDGSVLPCGKIGVTYQRGLAALW